ncbi:SCO5389 family protein [Actinocorallia sp. API 0066]|uniref:SCO5389 family protein n=1 Tax=Actinocorallia sp. API 0066 TaxID=2896846 RepID=UPI001E3279EF|nr:SCO5389 family protein [Actinocorallia sp. API 0066]MCD0451352.1 SCO5389 family protein [Actinocorallia sp. API 0066]
MSLDVSPQLLERAQQGEIDDATFVECIRTSLPYAWDLISGLVADLEVAGGDFADNQTPPPDEQARGQLLRVLASDAMRGSIERYFGVKLAFQNCHRVAVFPKGEGTAYRQFVTAREQILNQQPHLRDC